MQRKFRWLFVPPAVALLLVLGPLGREPGRGAGVVEASSQDPVSAPVVDGEAAAPVTGGQVPPLPDVWQLLGTLALVLTVGGIALVVLQRIRRGLPNAGWAGGGGGGPVEAVAVRQSLRLSARHALHVVDFDGSALLLAEGDGGVHVLRAARDDADDREIADRAIDSDDGAEPRDFVVPAPPAARPATAGSSQQTLASFKSLLGRRPTPAMRAALTGTAGAGQGDRE